MIGIDLSDRSVKLVQLQSGKLLSHCRRAIPDGAMVKGVIQDEKKVAEVLYAAFVDCRLGGTIKDAAVASIPETQSFLRVLQIPIMEEDEINEAVQWQVAQHIPFGLENVYIDWQYLSKKNDAKQGMMEVLVGAAQKKVVDPLYRALETLHVDIAACELESQAIVRALVSQQLKNQNGLLIVDLGNSATNVVIHDQGTIRFTASLSRGIDEVVATLPAKDQEELNREEVAGKEKNITALAKKLIPAEEELMAEIRGIVDFYTTNNPEHPMQEVLLTGGGANLPGLDKAFLRFFDNVHVQRGNPWVNIHAPGGTARALLSVEESVSFSTAFGLALRPVIS